MKREERRERRAGYPLLCAALLGIAMSFTWPQGVDALCRPYNPTRSAQHSTDVFYGRVLTSTPLDPKVALDRGWYSQRVKLRVGRVEKGMLTGTVELTNYWDYECWPGLLEEGKEYLVYYNTAGPNPYLVWAVKSPSLLDPDGLKIVLATVCFIVVFLALFIRLGRAGQAGGQLPS